MIKIPTQHWPNGPMEGTVLCLLTSPQVTQMLVMDHTWSQLLLQLGRANCYILRNIVSWWLNIDIIKN